MKLNKTNLIHTLEKVVKHVFMTMFDSEIEQASDTPKKKFKEHQIVGTVGLSGNPQGMVCLQMSNTCAEELACSFMRMDPSEIEGYEEINDAIGEVANIISGEIKTELSQKGKECALSIPSIIRGTKIEIESVRHVASFQFVFRKGSEPILVSLYLHDDEDSESVKKVLLVDDSQATRRLMAKTFAAYDCKILHASNGEECLSCVKDEIPDLILLDITMPVRDGASTLELLKEDKKLKNIPVVMLTSNSTEAEKKEMLKLGAEKYLTKSYRPEEVLKEVLDIIDLEHR